MKEFCVQHLGLIGSKLTDISQTILILWENEYERYCSFELEIRYSDDEHHGIGFVFDCSQLFLFIRPHSNT